MFFMAVMAAITPADCPSIMNCGSIRTVAKLTWVVEGDTGLIKFVHSFFWGKSSSTGNSYLKWYTARTCTMRIMSERTSCLGKRLLAGSEVFSWSAARNRWLEMGQHWRQTTCIFYVRFMVIASKPFPPIPDLGTFGRWTCQHCTAVACVVGETRPPVGVVCIKVVGSHPHASIAVAGPCLHVVLSVDVVSYHSPCFPNV